MPENSGPYLQAAFFAETVLQEPNGVVSAIRIVDQQTQLAVGADVADEMPPLVATMTIFISVKPGETRGRYSLRIAPEAPSGQKMPELTLPVNFAGEPDRGVQFVLPTQLQLSEEGLYWFDVIWVDGRGNAERLLTRMPLRVVYQPQPNPPAATPDA